MQPAKCQGCIKLCPFVAPVCKQRSQNESRCRAYGLLIFLVLGSLFLGAMTVVPCVNGIQVCPWTSTSAPTSAMSATNTRKPASLKACALDKAERQVPQTHTVYNTVTLLNTKQKSKSPGGQPVNESAVTQSPNTASDNCPCVISTDNCSIL